VIDPERHIVERGDAPGVHHRSVLDLEDGGDHAVVTTFAPSVSPLPETWTRPSANSPTLTAVSAPPATCTPYPPPLRASSAPTSTRTSPSFSTPSAGRIRRSCCQRCTAALSVAVNTASPGPTRPPAAGCSPIR